MAFELPTDRTSAEATTVSRYSLSRLGASPSLTVGYAETALGFEVVSVAQATDLNRDGVFETLRIDRWLDNPSVAVGLALTKEDGTAIGTIGTYVVTPAVPATDSTPAVPAYGTATLTSGGFSSAAPTTVRAPMINSFGVRAQVGVNGGRQWDLVLSSSYPSQNARMQTMLGTVSVTLVAMALAALGIAKTQAEIAAVIQSLAAQGNSLDSIIASQCEQLERDRRSGALAPGDVLVGATAPAVVASL